MIATTSSSYGSTYTTATSTSTTPSTSEGTWSVFESESFRSVDQTPFPKKKRKKRAVEKPNFFHRMMLDVARRALGEGCADLIPYTDDIHRMEEDNSYGLHGSHEDIKQILVLHWPYLRIVNRNGNEHEIKDMYVGLYMASDCFRGSICGMRGTVTQKEKASEYGHSHLPGICPWFVHFCTGTDGINDVYARLTSGNYTSNTEEYPEMFEGLCHHLTAFLSYESLEGVPHRRLENIGNNSEQRIWISNQDILIAIRDAVYVIGEDFHEHALFNAMDMTFDYNSGRVRLVENEMLHSMLASCTPHPQIRMPDGAFVDPAMQQPVANGFFVSSEERFKFDFCGNEVRAYVEPCIPLNNEEKDERRKYCNTQIFKAIEKTVTETVESFLWEDIIDTYENNSSERNGQIGNRRQVDVSDIVLLDEEWE